MKKRRHKLTIAELHTHLGNLIEQGHGNVKVSSGSNLMDKLPKIEMVLSTKNYGEAISENVWKKEGCDKRYHKCLSFWG